MSEMEVRSRMGLCEEVKVIGSDAISGRGLYEGFEWILNGNAKLNDE